MINCAHPTHFPSMLRDGGNWLERLCCIRANVSKRSHAELDEATEPDSGNPEELGESMAALTELAPKLSVFGGCCGTDHRHIEQIARAIRSKHSGTIG